MNSFDSNSLDKERLWIEQAKKDINRFEPLYLKYHNKIFRYVFRRTDDEALTGDITSQTFYKAMVHLHQFQWQGKPILVWLYTIAGNEIKRHFKSKREVFLVEEDKLVQAPELKDDWPQIRKDQVTRLLSMLKDEELELVELKFFEGLTFEEMSVVLGKKESAIKMRMYRLLKKLKDKIE